VSEKFGRTIDLMVSTNRSLCDRLVVAYAEQAAWAEPPERASGPPIDQDLKDRITSLHERLLATGDLAATVGSFDDEELQDVAKELIGINYALHRAKDDYMTELRGR